MHEFGPSVDLTGMHGVVKPRSFELPANQTVKERTFVVKSGEGTKGTPGPRRVKGTWLSDGLPDTISSYDFEYVLDGATRINRLPEPQDETKPVKLATELPPKPVKRKR